MRKSIIVLFTITALTISLDGCKDKVKEAKTARAEMAIVTKVSSEKYQVDINTSFIEWKGFKPTGSHNGTINLENGTFYITDGKINSGTFLINMNSIVCKDLEGNKKANLEAHLKGTVKGKEGDFFNVTKFPYGTFEITKLEDVEGKAMLSGNLTLKGIKHNITFPVIITNKDKSIILTSEIFTIDRTKWNINYGSKSVFGNLGNKFINDDIELKITVKATKS